MGGCPWGLQTRIEIQTPRAPVLYPYRSRVACQSKLPLMHCWPALWRCLSLRHASKTLPAHMRRVAAERAAVDEAGQVRGPGSFRVKLLDELDLLCAAQLVHASRIGRST